MSSPNAAQQHDPLKQAKHLIQRGDLKRAEITLDQLLAQKPLHRDGLYYKAVCQRKRQDFPAAMATLDRLIEHHGDYGRAYQERGHNFLSLNQPDNAGEAFLAAVERNDALSASWRALSLYYKSANDLQAAEQALKRAQILESMPRELSTVASLVNENKLYLAEQICREYLRKDKTHPEGMRLLAEIGSKLRLRKV